MSSPDSISHFDLIVVGGGSGGLAAAKEAAKLHPDKKVLCLNYVTPSLKGTKWGLGGTCVNVGCIPKKLMHHAGSIGGLLHKDAKQYGWNGVEAATHSWSTMKGLISDYINSLNFAYGVGLRSAGVTYANALGTFEGPNQLSYTTSSGKTTKATFDRALIAVGGRPSHLAIPGQELAITSDDLFWQKNAPGKTLIIGAGYIALECASFLHHIGTDVSVMVRGLVLRKMDHQSGEMIAELMERDGIRFLAGSNPVAFRSTGAQPILPEDSIPHPTMANFRSIQPDAKGNQRYLDPSTGVIQTVHTKPSGLITYAPATPDSPIEVTYTDSSGQLQKESFQTILVATGRTANTAGLNLAAAGVRTLPDAKILVDAYEATTNPSIYAIGDVASGIGRHGDDVSLAIDRPELTPVAIQAGQLLARRLWGPNERETQSNVSPDHPSKMAYQYIATTVFTSPSEYAFIGMSEEQARLPVLQGGIGQENVEVYWSRFGNLEISPLHPEMPALRSEHFTGPNQWSIRYTASRGISWPEHQFDPNGLSSHVYYRPPEACESVSAMVQSKEEDPSTGLPTYTIKVNGSAAPITGVPAQFLRLQPDSAIENGELFYKANCLAKLIVDKSKDERVVGLHFVGPQAGEVVQGFALGVSMHATKARFDSLVGIHPTAAEEFTVLTVKQSEGKTPLKQAGCGGGSCG